MGALPPGPALPRGYLSMVITVQDAAVQAAARVAAGLGVTSDEPVVLADGANVIVHLRPSPVVAKVAASTAAVRADTAGWLKRELDLAQFLAAAGVPVMTPSPEIPATTYHGDGLVMSFWRYLRSSGGARPDEATIGSMLRDLHAALRSYPDPLPVLAPLGDIPAFLARPQTRLSPAQAVALSEAYARLTAELDLASPPGQALHGDAGAGNRHRHRLGLARFRGHLFRSGGLGSGRLDGEPAPGRPACPGCLRRAGRRRAARGLRAAPAAAPDRLVRPLRRTPSRSAAASDRTSGLVVARLTPQVMLLSEPNARFAEGASS